MNNKFSIEQINSYIKKHRGIDCNLDELLSSQNFNDTYLHLCVRKYRLKAKTEKIVYPIQHWVNNDMSPTYSDILIMLPDNMFDYRTPFFAPFKIETIPNHNFQLSSLSLSSFSWNTHNIDSELINKYRKVDTYTKYIGIFPNVKKWFPVSRTCLENPYLLGNLIEQNETYIMVKNLMINNLNLSKMITNKIKKYLFNEENIKIGQEYEIIIHDYILVFGDEKKGFTLMISR